MISLVCYYDKTVFLSARAMVRSKLNKTPESDDCPPQFCFCVLFVVLVSFTATTDLQIGETVHRAVKEYRRTSAKK